jgi:glycosyltransferase involved in cell wall biosynthesis
MTTNNRPTLCFATMCKNEEHCIQNTLESVYKYIDYWVVCDTGSTDRTCEIVKTFFEEKGIPGELHVDEWVGFDVNKTLMMGRAKDKADYVMHLDADDLLVGDFKFTNEDISYDAYYIPVKRGVSEWKAWIIFNNRVTWKFCGVAHTTIKCLEIPHVTSFDLSNRGFYVSGEGIGSRAFDPKKYYYDAVKLEKQFWNTIVNDPDGLNLRSVFYTAQSYMDSDMIEDGLKWNSLYLKMDGGWIEEKFEAQMRIGICMIRLDYPHDRIIQEMEKAITMFPDRSEPLFHIGSFCNRIQQHENAYKYLTRALSNDINKIKEKYRLFIDEQAYGRNLYDELSVACFWTDRFQEGLNYLNQIIDDEKYSYKKDRLLQNKRHFNDRLGIPNE